MTSPWKITQLSIAISPTIPQSNLNTEDAHNQFLHLIGDPPNNENPALKEDLDDDIDDSDYMKDSKDDGSISSDDDISFEDEKDMDLEHEA